MIFSPCWNNSSKPIIMIIQKEKEQIFTKLQNEKQKFTISSSPKAFHILMDGLYSDKIQSIVRELTSNAYDAHLVCEQERPFEITCPTSLAPTFSVRDFGNSMDHEFVMELYSSVFYSSKEMTNDQVGTFGLGSKSPFSYTDSFTLTTYRDGEMRVYSCYLDEDRAPNIVHAMTGETTEDNGTLVSFEVEVKDAPLFAKAIKQVCRAYWRHLPVVHNLTLPAFEIKSLNDELDFMYSVKSNTPVYGYEVYFSQGNVWYKVPDPFLHVDNYSRTSKDETYEKINWVPRGLAVVMEVPLGTFNITPSREALSLDKISIANINEWIRNTRSKISGIIDKEYDKCKSRLEAHLTYRRMIAAGYTQELVTRTFKDPRGLSYSSNNLYLRPQLEDTRQIDVPRKGRKLSELKPGWLYTRDTNSVSSTWSPRIYLDSFDPEKIHLWVGLEEKIIRKASRLREAFSSYSYRNGVLHLACFREDLKKWVKLLDLKPNQITSIASLPDPGSDKTPTKKEKSKNLLPNDVFFVSTIRDKVSAKDPHISKNADYGEVQRFYSQIGRGMQPSIDKRMRRMYWDEYDGDDTQHFWPQLKAHYGLDKIVDFCLQGTWWPTISASVSSLAMAIIKHEGVKFLPIMQSYKYIIDELDIAVSKEIERRKKHNEKLWADLCVKYPILTSTTDAELIEHLRGNKCSTSSATTP